MTERTEKAGKHNDPSCQSWQYVHRSWTVLLPVISDNPQLPDPRYRLLSPSLLSSRFCFVIHMGNLFGALTLWHHWFSSSPRTCTHSGTFHFWLSSCLAMAHEKIEERIQANFTACPSLKSLKLIYCRPFQVTNPGFWSLLLREKKAFYHTNNLFVVFVAALSGSQKPCRLWWRVVEITKKGNIKWRSKTINRLSQGHLRNN